MNSTKIVIEDSCAAAISSFILISSEIITKFKRTKNTSQLFIIKLRIEKEFTQTIDEQMNSMAVDIDWSESQIEIATC